MCPEVQWWRRIKHTLETWDENILTRKLNCESVSVEKEWLVHRHDHVVKPFWFS